MMNTHFPIFCNQLMTTDCIIKTYYLVFHIINMATPHGNEYRLYNPYFIIYIILSPFSFFNTPLNSMLFLDLLITVQNQMDFTVTQI
jgi:hypothetical protein